MCQSLNKFFIKHHYHDAKKLSNGQCANKVRLNNQIKSTPNKSDYWLSEQTINYRCLKQLRIINGYFKFNKFYSLKMIESSNLNKINSSFKFILIIFLFLINISTIGKLIYFQTYNFNLIIEFQITFLMNYTIVKQSKRNSLKLINFDHF